MDESFVSTHRKLSLFVAPLLSLKELYFCIVTTVAINFYSSYILRNRNSKVLQTRIIKRYVTTTHTRHHQNEVHKQKVVLYILYQVITPPDLNLSTGQR